MSLQDRLTRLASDHREGDVFLRDLDGKTYTPQQLLGILSRADLYADAGSRESGTAQWITRLGHSTFGGVKSTEWFSIHGNPKRRGWARLFVEGGPYKIHFMEFNESEGRFVSLCNRDFKPNDHHTVFPNILESDPNLCKFCLKILHPEESNSDEPRAPRPRKCKLEVSHEEANGRLQDAIRQVLPLFEGWGIRRDALDEYWHTVYHRESETGDTTIRFVQKHSIGEKQLVSAKRAYATIMRESEKDAPRIKDYNEAERLVNLLADALRFAGYELNEQGNWMQVAK